jgi:hypothetical protein
MVSLMPLTLYSQRKSTWYPLDKGLVGSQIRSVRRGEEKILDSTGTVVYPLASLYIEAIQAKQPF